MSALCVCACVRVCACACVVVLGLLACLPARTGVWRDKSGPEPEQSAGCRVTWRGAGRGDTEAPWPAEA